MDENVIDLTHRAFSPLLMGQCDPAPTAFECRPGREPVDVNILCATDEERQFPANKSWNDADRSSPLLLQQQLDR
jgi:hypothetical protein